jgi:bifunctional UDP-N-acetylglucosamine pyrophosphorylase/glucosamine-1-phosphate N-acetyltransferase
MNRKIVAIILAAGRGERMKSTLPKVLHPICGRPMLGYVLDLVGDLKITNVLAVLGHKHKQVRKFLKAGIKVIIQRRLLGSADAVRQTENALKDFKGSVLTLYADNPLLRKDTLKKLIHYHIDNNLDVTLLTAKVKNPSGYGRVLRDKYGSICGIVEEKDADAFQKDIKEINIGCACFKKERIFKALRKVKLNKHKKEYYLTDVIEILYRQGVMIEAVKLSGFQEGLGINSRIDLARANKIMQARILDEHMKAGVTIVAPQTTFIDWQVKIGSDTKIYPFTVIERDVKIGKHCSIGPFCHLREGTTIEDNCRIGNFAEIARSTIARDTLAKHLCYLGDARVGSHVNIGAGVVTANFDGKNKNLTIIKDNAFLGSDTVLVAPVKIGKYATTGAGSVVTKNKDVSDYMVVAGVPAKPLRKR